MPRNGNMICQGCKNESGDAASWIHRVTGTITVWVWIEVMVMVTVTVGGGRDTGTITVMVMVTDTSMPASWLTAGNIPLALKIAEESMLFSVHV